MEWFNLYNSNFLDSSIADEVEVINIENSNSDNKIKSVKFILKSDFYKFNASKIQMQSYFGNQYIYKDEKHKKTLHANCDGTIIFKYNDKWYLLLCEIKSSWGFYTHNEAKAQIEASLLKIQMFTNCFTEFEDFKIIVFYISKDSEIQKRKLENGLNKKSNQNETDYNKLLDNNLNYAYNIDETFLKDYPIKDNYRLTNATIHLIKGDKQPIELSQYLN